MKIFAAIGAAAMALTASAPASADDERSEGEIKLAKMLDGRVAGKPQNCIRLFPSTDLTVIDGTALVYKVGGTLYVNIPRDPDRLDRDDALVTRSISTRLCRTDIVTTINANVGHYTGNIFLGEFVPYRRQK